MNYLKPNVVKVVMEVQENKYKAKRISAGHYIYRGYKVTCIGYYPPERKVVWEAEDENGNGFAHAFSLKCCKYWIDDYYKNSL